MMNQAQPKELSFLAKYILGQLISAAGENRLAKIKPVMPELVTSDSDAQTDITVITKEIFNHTFVFKHGDAEHRVMAFERYECHADGRVAALLSPYFLEWPGHKEFLNLFSPAGVKH